MPSKDYNKDALKFELVRHVGILKKYPSGWQKELNLVAWGEYAPKYDIRDWDNTHKYMSRGLTLKEDEAKMLYELLSKEEFA